MDSGSRISVATSRQLSNYHFTTVSAFSFMLGFPRKMVNWMNSDPLCTYSDNVSQPQISLSSFNVGWRWRGVGELRISSVARTEPVPWINLRSKIGHGTLRSYFDPVVSV